MEASTPARPKAAAAPRAIGRGHRNLLLTTAVAATLLIAVGGVVCATDSSAACPDWPGCFGRVIPPENINAIIEYTHRAVAGLTGLLILVSAVTGWARTRSVRWLTWPPTAAFLFTVVVALFGRAAVLTGLSRGAAAVDVGSALIVLTLAVTAGVVGWARYRQPALPDRLSSPGPAARVGLGAAVALYLVYVGGILTSGKGSFTRCIGWPMLAIVPADAGGGLQVIRLALAGVAAVLILVFALMVVRRNGGAGDWLASAGARRLALLLPLLIALELVLGLWIYTGGSTLWLVISYVSAAAVLYALLVALAVRAHLPHSVAA